jgi:hopanoid biosynthesis associated RND transporter like protein HpnN
MEADSPSLAVRCLTRLADLVHDRPRWFFYPHVVLFALSVFYTARNLEFHTARSALVGTDKRYHRNFLEFRKEFPGQDDMVVLVESENLEKNRQFVERLGARLEGETNLFTDIFYKGDLKMMGPKALLFLSDETLADLHKTLHEYRPFIQAFAQADNLNALFRVVNQQFRTAGRDRGTNTESLIKALPALERIVLQAADSMARPGTPPSPGVTAMFGESETAERGQYITFGNGRIYLVTARAVSEPATPEALRRLRSLVGQTQIEVPGVNVGLTGEPVLEFDEMAQSQKDTAVASVVSLVAVALIFILGYKETGRPIKATLSLIVGLGYTMGYTTLVIGHLNILTITFLPILIGLAIDFGVHLVTRYEEEMRHDRTEREALRKAMVNTGRGIFTGAFTTAGAFYAMALTDFKGVREMGLITGGGMLICLLPMMTLLPALLLRGRQNVIDHAMHLGAERRARLEQFWLERPRLSIAVTLALCGLSLAQLPRVRFDYNLLHLQSKDLPAVVFEQKLINSANKSVLYGVLMTNSLEAAVALERRLTNLPSVSTVESMARFLAEDPTNKLVTIGQIKRELAGLRFAAVDQRPANLRDLDQTLSFLMAYLSLAADEVEKENDPKLLRELRSLHEAIGVLRQRMSLADPAQAAAKLGAFQRALLTDLRETFLALRTQDNRGRLRVEDLPPALRNRFIGRSGKYLLQVYPRDNVWERGPQEVFVRELRTIDPDATGTPVQLLEYTTLLKDSFIEAAWYALAAIMVLVLIHFRRLSDVILSLVPVGVGTLWMAGLMGWVGVPFNPANIMTLPLVVGIGVTNGIHILNRFAEERTPSILAKSTGKAVVVSGLTTIAGFGSLMLAEHQGIASLGFVMSVGVAACMIAALTFLPALLRWQLGRAGQQKNPVAHMH